MGSIVGILIVVGSVIAGYLMEKGKLGVLLQPAELVVVAGAAVGTVLAANPMYIIREMIVALISVFKAAPYPKGRYLETLKMMYDLLVKAHKAGAIAIENDIEETEKSPVFSKYPDFLKDRGARDFVCDTMRMVITGGISVSDIDRMMELDMEVHHHGASQPSQALNMTAEALPGLGIVAAVLGIVITMGALGGPPEEIGKKVAAALVGTFVGILLCYGVVGPLASNMAKIADEKQGYYHVLSVVILSFIKGTAPIMAVELGRRAIPDHCRPNFDEVEKACRAKFVEPAGLAGGS